MPVPTWKCTECDKTFKAGDWECAAGGNHKVENKRYFMDDAPTVIQYDRSNNNHPYIDKKSSCTTVLNIPPERKVEMNGEVVRLPGGSVQFVRGLFETTDPEIQFYLDKKPGLVTEERWREVYLNDDEKIQMERMQLAAERSRLQQERNELLEQVKQGEAQKRRGRPPKQPSEPAIA